MKYQIAIIFLFAGLIFSCSEEETEPESGIELGATLTAEMGSDLSSQVYVDLSKGEMTTVAVNTWELALENAGDAIRINGAKKVAVSFPAETDFAAVTTDEGLVYYYDTEDGKLTTTALAGWTLNQPYIIDLGIDENGNVLGKKKFMITASGSSGISIQYAELDGSDAVSTDIGPEDGNFTYFSLINDEVVTIEPLSWDFVLTAASVRTGAPCFTMGNAAVPGINCDIYRLAASVVTNNHSGVLVAKDDPFIDLEQNDDPESEKNQQTIESSNFDNLLISDFNTTGGSEAADAIGRSWLQILQPHSNGIYKIYDFITYIVQDQDKNYYKVRFLAYRGGDNAENGFPTFEYELLTE